MSNVQIAIACFNENLRDFASPTTNAEKHNLYIGLAAMAESLREIEATLQDVQNRQRYPNRR